MGWGSIGRIAAGISTGGLSEVGMRVAKMFGGSVDNSSESEFQAKMNALGDTEMESYKNAKLSDSQTQQIEQATKSEQAQMRQKMADTGMADSTTRLSGESLVQQDKINMQETTLNQIKQMHWTQAMKAYGMSDQSSQVLAGMNETDRAAAMQVIAGVAGAAGGIAGSMRGTSVMDEYTNESATTPTQSYNTGYSGNTL